MHTWRSEEGPRQLAVSGDLFDLCDDVDESTDCRRDPVKAEHSGDKDRGQDKTVLSKTATTLVSDNFHSQEFIPPLQLCLLVFFVQSKPRSFP